MMNYFSFCYFLSSLNVFRAESFRYAAEALLVIGTGIRKNRYTTHTFIFIETHTRLDTLYCLRQ